MTTTETPNLTDAANTSAQQLLTNQCLEVRVSVSWFPTSRQVESQHSLAMSQAVGAEERALSHGKRLMSSKHPSIKAVNAARAALDNYVKSATLPRMRAVGTEDNLAIEDQVKDPGVRLILLKDVEAFDATVSALKQVIYRSVAAVDANFEEILEMERQRLGPVFNRRDYPDKVADAVSVRGPTYTQVGLSLDFAKICPGIYQRASRQLQQQLTASVLTAAEELNLALYESVRYLANSLSPKVRVYPVSRPELTGAEVVEYCDHDCASHIVSEPGQVVVTLKAPSGVTHTIGPMPEPEYVAQYRPAETNEQRRLYATAVSNLQEHIQSFHRISEMLGETGAGLASPIQQLSQLLSSGGTTDRQLVESLRTTRSYRERAITQLRTVTQELSQSLVSIPGSHARRAKRALDLPAGREA